MIKPPTHPRARNLGILGIAIYTLLSPSGKIISSAAAATLLVAGLVTQLRPPSPPAAQAPAPTPVVPTRLAHSGSSAPVFTYIEVDGETLPVVLTENPTDNSSAGHGPASVSPSLDLSGGGGRGPGAGSLPPQGEPGSKSHQSPSGNVPASLSEAPESQRTMGMDDPLNPLIPLSGQPEPLNSLIPLSRQSEPLLTSPYNGQSPLQTAVVSPAAIPEPSVIGLMLLGLAALGWTGRRHRLTPTRHA